MLTEHIVTCNVQTRALRHSREPPLLSPTALVCDDPPIIEHASYHVVDPHGLAESKNMAGARSFYSCDKEYKLVDENANVLKCERTTWVGKRPECLHRLQATCPEPSSIENGYGSTFSSNR